VQFVKYIGTAHRRIITAQDFRRAGFDHQTVEWSYLNNFAVPIDDFPGDLLDKVIKPDQFFIVVGGDEHSPSNGTTQRLTPAQAAGPRIDMMGAVGARSGSQAVSGASAGGTGPTPGGGSSSPTTVITGTGSADDSP
jgi:hypothetical protein